MGQRPSARRAGRRRRRTRERTNVPRSRASQRLLRSDLFAKTSRAAVAERCLGRPLETGACIKIKYVQKHIQFDLRRYQVRHMTCVGSRRCTA